MIGPIDGFARLQVLIESSNLNPLRADLDDIVRRCAGVWESLAGSRVFFTGGTGFIGTWMVETLIHAREQLKLDVEIVVLTRDPDAFLEKTPSFSTADGLRFLKGDVRNFTFPEEQFTHVVHAATTASGRMNLEQPFEMIDTVVNGSRRIFEFAGTCGARIVLNTSSGGIYGSVPPSIEEFSEEYRGAPDPLDPLAAYSESKRLAEMMGAIGARRFGYEHKVARITALVGPRLPLDIHYAIGNFIRDALRGEPIRILGDGTPVRSYFYIGDLIVWLLTIMVRGVSNRPYNVGSEQAMSLKEVAYAVSEVHGGKLPIVVGTQAIRDGRPNRYVPSTARARQELGLKAWTDLESALGKTFDWYRSVQSH